MRKAAVFRNGILAGTLSEISSSSYTFLYDNDYLSDDNLPPISLTMPKIKEEIKSNYLFPFFYNLLSEGVNKQLQSRQLKIDENDSFGLLLATAQFDTIGAVSVKPLEDAN